MLSWPLLEARLNLDLWYDLSSQGFPQIQSDESCLESKDDIWQDNPEISKKVVSLMDFGIILDIFKILAAWLMMNKIPSSADFTK